MAWRYAAHLSRGPRVRVQMEHGLDARFPALHEHRSDLPALSSRQHHVFAALRFSGKFYSRAQPRRNRVRQTFIVIQDARGRVAEICQSPDVSGVDVRTPRKKVGVHGRRIRSIQRMEPRHPARLGTTEAAAPRRRPPAGSTFELYL